MKIVQFCKKGKLKLFSILTISKNTYIRNLYWDLIAKEIHQKWGQGNGDYDTLEKIIKMINPKTILDV